MKKLALLLMFAPLCVCAQTGVLQGHCYLGGKQATTSGMNSSNYLNGIIPACTVTVYLTGTLTKQTITKPDGSALANPFTANTASAVDPGGWIFRAATNQGLDVVLSGGNSNPSCITAPLCYTQPVTLTDVFPTQSFTPAAGVTSAQGTVPIQVNGDSGNPHTGALTVSCLNATNSSLGCAQADGTTITATDGILSADIANNFTGVTADPLGTQHIVLYPITAPTCSISNPGGANCTNSTIAPFSSTITNFHWAVGGVGASATYTGFGVLGSGTAGLPSYIHAANVTSIYFGATGSSAIYLGTTGAGTCPVLPITMGASSLLASGSPAQSFNYATYSCDYSLASSAEFTNPQSKISVTPYLVVYYTTDPAPPTSSALIVGCPLDLVGNTLGMPLPADSASDTGTANAYAVTLCYSGLTPGTTIEFTTANANTSTTPTLTVLGVPPFTTMTGATIVKSVNGTATALAAGDIINSSSGGIPAVVTWGADGKWYLQNPQTGGASISLTTTGTSGAATLMGSVLNVPQYQGALTLTTTGTSGAATLAGNVLNIPQYSGGGGGGVTSIVPGTNVTCSPNSGGTCVGNVTINSTGGGGGGVQYETGSVIFAGPDSSIGDDSGNILGNTITVTAVSWNSGVCSFTNSGTNGFSAGDWFSTMGISSPSFLQNPIGNQGVYTNGIAFLQVLSTGLTSTTFEANCTGGTGTGSGTGGTVETANGFLPYLTAKEPFFKGGSIAPIAALPNGSTVAALDTNYSTVVTPWVTGGTQYLFLAGAGKNDIGACNSAAVIEGHLQSVWSKAHAQGLTVIQATTFPTAWNSLFCPTVFTTFTTLNTWLREQSKNITNASSGQYWDRIVDQYNLIGTDTTDNNLIAGNGGYGPAGVQLAAEAANSAMSAQDSYPPVSLTCSSLWNCTNFTANNTFKSTSGLTVQTIDTTGNTSAGLKINDDANSGASLYGQWHNVPFVSVPGGLIDFQGGGSAGTNYGVFPGSGGVLGFLNGTSAPSSADTGFSRDSAGVVDLGNGSPGSKTGTLNLTNLNVTGTCTGCGSGFTASGDLSGTSTSQTVIGLKTVPFCTGYTPTNGQLIQYTTASSPNPCYQAINAPSGSFTAGGDLSGTSSSQQVVGLESVPFCSGYAPTAGQIIVYTTGGSPSPCYTAQAAPSGSFSAGGDLSGTSSSQHVVGINSVPLCTGFTPTAGQSLQYTTSSSPNPCWTAATPSGLYAGLIHVPTVVGTGMTTAWNQGGSYSSGNVATGIQIADTGTTGRYEGILATYPASPFTLTELWSLPPRSLSNFWTIGTVIAASPTGANLTFRVAMNSSFGADAYSWTGPGVSSTLILSLVGLNQGAPLWTQLVDNGTTVTYQVSSDGVNWLTIGSITKSTYAGDFNYLGIFINPQGVTVGTTLMSWQIH